MDNAFQHSRKELPSKINTIGMVLLVLGLLAAVLAFFVDRTRSSYNLLLNFMFIISIGLGSLFLVALEYVAGAVWSTPFRRVSEFLSALLYLVPIIAIPLFFNMHDLFHWSHQEAMETDRLLQEKSPFLNTSFFIIRGVVVFVIWLLFYFFITKNSKSQDENGRQELTRRNIKLSAVFMPVFAFTISLAAIDWIMSLEAHWFSTIFGVYYFSGTVLAALASATIIIVLLKENNYLPAGLVSDHYYSLGALLFAFTNFWAYIAFSQYLLIWYANLPEETFWFAQRWEGSWQIISLGIILVHFVIPYAGLLSQSSKMNPKRLFIMSSWILFAHYYDLYWLIMPNYNKSGLVFGWIEIAFVIATIGVIILLFRYKMRNNNLVPVGDPKLKRAMDFRL